MAKHIKKDHIVIGADTHKLTAILANSFAKASVAELLAPIKSRYNDFMNDKEQLLAIAKNGQTLLPNPLQFQDVAFDPHPQALVLCCKAKCQLP